jgi:hypothetical protein
MVPKAAALRLARPEAMRRGVDRLTIVALWAEAILGARAHLRLQAGEVLYITRSPLAADSILFPTGHDREGQPRHRWERQPDGSTWGWLVEGADSVFDDAAAVMRTQKQIDDWLLHRQKHRKK